LVPKAVKAKIFIALIWAGTSSQKGKYRSRGKERLGRAAKKNVTPGGSLVGKKTSPLNRKTIRESPTERVHPGSIRLDCLSARQITRLIHQEDQKVLQAVKSQLNSIGRVIEMVKASLSQGGRLLYVGAGSSGRLGVLDAAECPPTFGVPGRMVQGILAGGRRALWKAVEGAEDDWRAGARAMDKAGVRSGDVVCGITASGKTPFVQGALREARKRGAQTVLITSHPQPLLAPLGNVLIKAIVGPEVIAGSTRMKAGTATKMILNMISTGAMIGLGKIWGPWMIDLQPKSRKLKARALRILMSILKCSRQRAQRLLRASGGKTKVAIVMGARNIGRKEAERWILENPGPLRGILFKN
jgi:N-acetylmuramic acid 6-phosphate etherase